MASDPRNSRARPSPILNLPRRNGSRSRNPPPPQASTESQPLINPPRSSPDDLPYSTFHNAPATATPEPVAHRPASASTLVVREVEVTEIPDDAIDILCKRCHRSVPLIPLREDFGVFSAVKCNHCGLRQALRYKTMKERAPEVVCVKCACGHLVNYDPARRPVVCPHCFRHLKLKVMIKKSSRIYVCVNCNGIFETEISKKFSRCSHCQQMTALGKNYGLRRAIVCYIFGAIAVAGTIALIVITLPRVERHSYLYGGWAGAFVLCLGFFIMGLCFNFIAPSKLYVRPAIPKPIENQNRTQNP